MALSNYRYPPNTVFLGGMRTEVNDLVASEAITPGHLVERFNAAGVPKFRKHATAAAVTTASVATDAHMLNKGVDDPYAAGDLIEVSIGAKGSTFWLLIASGQNIAAGDYLESAGDGTVRKFAAGAKLFQALEAKDNSGGPTAARVKAETV